MVLYSMASDRSTYDQGAFLVKTKESIKPLAYVLNVGAHENCTPCGDKPNVSVHEERVNLENDILGLTRKLSKDPKQKYQKNDKIADVLNYNPPYLCERYIVDPSFRDQNTGNKYMEDLKKTQIATQ